ncbi:MAG: hypothetical protein IPO92_07955 [Saprospiraceae bacterium]|nr:hypothetical protein [Saprospiraceae bacterium]
MGNNKIQDAIENGYDFNTMSYYSKGWKIFSQNPGGYLGFEAIQILVGIILGLIPLVGSILQMIINPPLQVGIPIAANDQELKNDNEFGNFFKGFEHFVPLLIANIVKTVIALIVVSPVIVILGIAFFKAFMFQDMELISDSFESMMDYWWLIAIIGLIEGYIFISFRWANYLIVFHQYEAIQALKTSWALVNKNLLGHIGFGLMAIPVFIVGLLALIVGIFVAVPVIFTADYAGYADITGLDEKVDIIDEIGIGEDLV